MTIKKFEVRPPGVNQDYSEVVYPVTHKDAVIGLSEILTPLDNKINNHINDTEKHLLEGERDKINNALPKTGGTSTGDLIVAKVIPRVSLRPDLTPKDSTKTFDIFYNAAGSNNFGAFMNKDGKNVMVIHNDKDVRFFGHDDAWFSVQDLKQSVSNGKSAIANAITQMGVPTAVDAEFAIMANNILAISSIVSGTGTFTSNGSQTIFSVTGLSFIPRAIIITGLGNIYIYAMYDSTYGSPTFTSVVGNTNMANVYNVFYGGFELKIAFPNGAGGFGWIAIK